MQTLAFAQFPEETVGSPTNDTTVNMYNGWINQGLFTFSGNAAIQRHPSDNQGASGGGNVFFTNVLGTNFEIGGFPAANRQPNGISITFGIHNSQGTTLGNLIFEYSTDDIKYTKIVYDTIVQMNTWTFRRCFIDSNLFPQNLKLRFRQNSSINQYRLDDIQIEYVYLLPLRLEQFFYSLNESAVRLFWSASSNSIKEAFIVERSFDGSHFNPIVTQEAKGKGTFDYQTSDVMQSNRKI